MYWLSPLDGTKQEGRLMQCEAIGLDYDEASEFFIPATPTNFLSHYNHFVEAFPESAKLLSRWRPPGVGPGEMVTFFIFDNVTIGGMNRPYDIYLDDIPFAEFKGGQYCQKRHSLDDFQLSRDQDKSSRFIIQVVENTSAKQRFSVDNQLVLEWKQKIFEEYIEGKNFALIQNNDLRMRHFGPLTKEMVDLYRVHRNTPRARVYLPKE